MGTSAAELLEVLGSSGQHLATVRQVHGVAIHTITKEVHLQAQPLDDQVESDGILTDVPGLVVAVRVADCCGIVLHDAVRRVVGVVHSGWRGTAQGVTTAAITTMQAVFGTSAQDLFVWLSPCASAANYQVGPDVRSVLSKFCEPDPRTKDRWLFDNHKALVAELLSCGVLGNHIEVDASCTIADSRFHSYRRDKERSDRGLVFAQLAR